MIKRILKGAGALVAGVVILAGGFAGYVQATGIPRYDVKIPELKIEVTPERVARGAKFASLLCVECHENSATHELTGRRLADLPPEFGEIYSKNITKHPTKGIGGWTDGQLASFLRTGVRPDGQYVPPWMVKMPHLSDEDLASIIAFLRSDDPRVAARDVDPPGVTKPTFLSKALTHTVMKPLPYPTAPIAAPPKSDRVAFGRYLVNALDCFSCHSADFKKVDIMTPEKSAGYFGGGNTLMGANGKPIHSANLTPDEATGIGRWTEADFVRAVKSGFRPDGKVLRYPMMPMTSLEDDEVSAIYAYLRTVPKLENPVARNFGEPAVASGPPSGEKLYASYGCTACHGDTGVGLGGAADLRKSNEHYPTDDALRAWIDEAPQKKPGTRMPGWKGIIREADYAPLMQHVRSLSSPTGASAAR